jgi:hypothetical protein
MKKAIVTVLALLVVFATFSQAATTDRIYKHSGEVLEVKILKISDLTIIFKVPNQELQENISKLAVDHIVFSTGVEQKISDKIVVSGKKDADKVQIIEDKDQAEGLKKGSAITGETSAFNWRSANASGKKALQKLKEQAAEANAPFVFMTMDHDTQNAYGMGAKGLKKGFIYTY